MRKAKVAVFVPGGYLVVTRYPGWVPVAGFFWLEVLPLTCLLYYNVGTSALMFPVLHWLFLGCYELGYMVNDRAETASERPARPRAQLGRIDLFWAVIVRIVAWCLTVALCLAWFGVHSAWWFVFASVAVVGTLFVHTYIGTMSRRISVLRVASFAGLAFGKYAPAALALAPSPVVVQGLGWIFLLYGAGRVIDYSVKKFAASRFEVIEINTLWYFAVLVPALGLIVNERAVDGAFESLYIFGLYYALQLIKRTGQRFWGQL